MALLRNGIPGTEMTALALSDVANQNLRDLAIYVLEFRTGNTAGSSARLGPGAALFRGKGKCLDCHRVNGEGRTIGPDLSEIGNSRDAAWLRRAVLEPEADIFDSFTNYRWTIQLPDNFLLVEITTRSGDRVTGSRINEDAFSIQIRDEQGRIRSFHKKQVAELRKHWGKSPMPSYKDVFSAAELEDIVSYLASLKGAK
jgi:putative heme-binding domain-containing protein